MFAVAGVTAAAATGLAVAGTAGAMSSPTTKPITITVTMSDYRFKLSKTSVPKGSTVVFNVVNKGPAPHDFDLEGTKGTPVIESGKKTTLKATLKKAGPLRFICTVPRHASFGMDGTFTVK